MTSDLLKEAELAALQETRNVKRFKAWHSKLIAQLSGDQMNKPKSSIVMIDNFPCVPHWSGYYGNGRQALSMFHAETGETVLHVSVNLHEDELNPGEMAISHNVTTDQLISMIDANLISLPHRGIKPRASFVIFGVCYHNKESE